LAAAALLMLACESLEPAQAQAQAVPAKAAEPQLGWLDHWRLSTFSFGRVQNQNNKDFFEVIGTGILVATDEKTP
jgi:hypothetical protein